MGARLRANLAAAQRGAEAARKGAERAAEAAERARQGVEVAGRAVGAYAAADARIAKHRADAIRAGQTPAALPSDLVELRREQEAAGRELVDAEAAHEVLEQEAAEARQRADQAQAELRAAVEAVAREEFDKRARELTAAEQALAVRRVELASFVDGASIETVHGPALNLARDVRHALLIEMAPPGAAKAGCWTEFRRALLTNPGAQLAMSGKPR